MDEFSTPVEDLELLLDNSINSYRFGLYDHAIDYFSNIISIIESSSNREVINHFLILRAYTFFIVREYKKAISDFSKCIDNGYINSESFDHDSDSFLGLGKFKYFLKDFEFELCNFFCRGLCKFHIGEFDGAIKDMTNHLSLKSQNKALPYYIRGYCRIEINQFKLALEDFSKAIDFYSVEEEVKTEKIFSLDLEYEEILSKRALCHFKLANFKKAKSDYTALLKINPHHDYFFKKALCNNHLNNFGDSHKDILLAIDNCSDESEKKEFIKFKNELEEKIDHTKNHNVIEANENNEENKVNQKALKEAREKLNKLIGIDNIKIEIENIISFTLLQIERKKFGLKPEFISNNFIFLGSPGTGKTEVARLIGKILGSLGVLTKGHFIETDRAGLIGTYLGETANKTLSLCKKALGGVLFIDEAYSLTNQLKEDYGHEAIAILLKFMEDNRDNISIIAAGYPYEMEKFLDSNSGLRSRFGTKLNFKNYLPEELFQILILMINQRERSIKDTSLKYVEDLVLKISLNKNKTFGNARSIRNLVEIAIKNQSLRLIKKKHYTKNDFIDLFEEDFSLSNEQLINL